MSSWVKDLRPGESLFRHAGGQDDKQRRCVMTEGQFDALDLYETTIPTGPSPGRIYRSRRRPGDPKPEFWTHAKRDPNRIEPRYVFVCEPCDGVGCLNTGDCVAHIPYRVELLIRDEFLLLAAP